ncbi:MAG TPA: DUF4340 domain-containing protein [Burkholderiales bacterium]
MNARIALILVVLLAVLGGAALVFYQQERGRQAGNVGTLGQPVLKDLKAAEVASIRIVEPGATLTVQRKDERWLIAERDGFPADIGKVREFVLQALSLKVGQSEPIGEKDRARLNLDASGTQVQFASAEGKTLGELIVGKKYFKREVDNPEKARADGRFVALPGDPKTVYLVSDPLTQATARSAEWIERTSFQVEKVKSLELRYPDGGGWRIEREGDNAEWRLAGLRPGEKLDVAKANAASYSLSLLELADVAPKDVKDTGLDKPVAIEATTLEGLAYSIKVGKPEGDNYYVSFTSSGTPAKDDKHAERRKLLSEYVLLMPKSKLEDTLKKRDELLEQKDNAGK